MEKDSRGNIALVIVVYNLEDIDSFNQKVENFADLFDVFIIDNGGNQALSFETIGNVTLLLNGYNAGTCSVLNDILDRVSNDKYSSLLFLDQDTDLVVSKLGSLRSIQDYNWGFLTLESYGLKELWIRTFNVPRFQFSGSFFSIEILREISSSNSQKIFLDYCDWLLYWNLRRTLGEPSTLPGFVEHHVYGEPKHKFSPFSHSPSRIYFQVKNLIILLPLSIVPISVKFFLVLRFLLICIMIPILSKPKKRYKELCRGLRDGIYIMF